jgi:plasmid stability protein
MAIQITIRGVSEDVRDELAARASREGKSMQEYLRAELERLAALPPVRAWVAEVRERKRLAARRVARGEILRQRDADRR